MIGDTMETDILGGVQLGYHTVLVLSGGTRREDLPRYAYQPEIVVDSVAEFADLLAENGWRSPWPASGSEFHEILMANCRRFSPSQLPIRGADHFAGCAAADSPLAALSLYNCASHSPVPSPQPPCSFPSTASTARASPLR